MHKIKKRLSSWENKYNINQKLILLLSVISISVLLLIFVFIFKESIPALKKFGFKKIFLSANFSPSNGKYGVWNPLMISIITSLLAVIFARFFAVRIALFIHFRAIRFKRITKIIIKILVATPSIFIGILVVSSIGKVIFGAKYSQSVLSASLALFLMILPIIVSIVLNKLKNLNLDNYTKAIALGNTKTQAIYGVVKKEIRFATNIAAIIGLSRAIGETMAVSIILQGSSDNLFSRGFLDILTGNFATLGGEIAYNMGTDSGDKILKNSLYAAGLALFIVILIINTIIYKLSYSKKRALDKKYLHRDFYYQKNIFLKKEHQQNLFNVKEKIFMPFRYTWYYFRLIKHKVYIKMKHILFIVENFILRNTLAKKVVAKTKGDKVVKLSTIDKLNLFFKIIKLMIFQILFGWLRLLTTKTRIIHANKTYQLYHGSVRQKFIDNLRLSWEMICLIIVNIFIFWIAFYILIKGGQAFNPSNLFTIKKNTVGNSVMVTLYIIWLSILIAFPFALITGIYLSEYGKGKRSSKIINYFLDALSATPSILFGMFGLVFFLQTMHLASSGYWKTGSILAGSLTMSIVIFPSLTKRMNQAFLTVDNELRHASYAMGVSKFKTAIKVVIPNSITAIFENIIISICRIISETAPIFLTAGLISSKNFGLMYPGQTLTSRILNAKVYSSSAIEVQDRIANEALFVSFIMIILLILLAEFLPEINKTLTKAKNLVFKKKAKEIKHV